MKKLLKELGLNKNEILIYETTLTRYPITPIELARETGIKRTTAYGIARTLAERGFLVEDSSKRPRVFTPSSPAEVLGVVKEEKSALEKKEKAIKELSEVLVQKTASKTYPVPKVRFVEEKNMERFLKQETPKWHRAIENLSEAIWWGFQDHTFVKEFRDWIDWQWDHAPESVSLRMLTNRSNLEKNVSGKYPKRNMRYWDGSDNFVSSTWAIEEYVVVINTRQRPFYLYEIHDPLLSHDLREIFKKTWTELK